MKRQYRKLQQAIRSWCGNSWAALEKSDMPQWDTESDDMVNSGAYKTVLGAVR